MWIDWTYGTEAGECVAATLSPSIDVDFTYPRLIADGDVSQDFVNRWDRYISSLRQHEEGHEQNGIDALFEAIDGITLLHAPSCTEYEQRADAQLRDATAAGNAADVAHDAATDHGRSRGAHLR